MIEPRLYETMLNYQKVMNSNNIRKTEQQNNTYNMFRELLESYISKQQAPMNSFNLEPMQSNQLPFTHSSVSPVSTKATESHNNLKELIDQAANQFGIDRHLLNKVIQTESNFNPNAVSEAGASGLMQLMPATARALGVTNVFDPAQNIEAGSKYLKDMLDRYDGDIKLALAAYNAGPGNVDRYQGIPPFEETQNYVKKILG